MRKESLLKKIPIPLILRNCMIREGFNKKKQKKIWIYPYLGLWVGQDGDNIHKKTKKNMPLKSILDHFKSF